MTNMHTLGIDPQPQRHQHDVSVNKVSDHPSLLEGFHVWVLNVSGGQRVRSDQWHRIGFRLENVQ